jgi:hypothetical protein
MKREMPGWSTRRVAKDARDDDIPPPYDVVDTKEAESAVRKAYRRGVKAGKQQYYFEHHKIGDDY